MRRRLVLPASLVFLSLVAGGCAKPSSKEAVDIKTVNPAPPASPTEQPVIPAEAQNIPRPTAQ